MYARNSRDFLMNVKLVPLHNSLNRVLPWPEDVLCFSVQIGWVEIDKDELGLDNNLLFWRWGVKAFLVYFKNIAKLLRVWFCN